MGVLGWLEERRNVVTLSVISALRGAGFNLRWVIWQPFVLSLGVPMGSLGGLESLADLTRISIQPMVGSASDVHGRRKFLIAREVLVLGAGLLFIFAGSWSKWDIWEICDEFSFISPKCSHRNGPFGRGRKEARQQPCSQGKRDASPHTTNQPKILLQQT